MNETPLQSLAALEWVRLRVQIRNTRNIEGKRHPLFVFRGEFYDARSSLGDPLNGLDILWHPSHSWFGDRIIKGSVYEADIIFPTATMEEAGRFVVNLKRHFDGEKRFVLETEPLITKRTLSILEQEHRDHIDPTKDEICLDFITPQTFKATDPLRRWILRPDGFLDLLRHRLSTLNGGLPVQLPVAAQDISLLPYYWRFFPNEESPGMRVATPKGEAIFGYRGPLYLRGTWQPLLPAILLLSEFQLERGDERRRGQGFFRPSTHRPFFDAELLNPSRFAAAADEFMETNDSADEFAELLADHDAALKGIVAEIREQRYQCRPACLFPIQKTTGDTRMIAQLHPRDALIQQTVLGILQKPFDRMFEEAIRVTAKAVPSKRPAS